MSCRNPCKKCTKKIMTVTDFRQFKCISTTIMADNWDLSLKKVKSEQQTLEYDCKKNSCFYFFRFCAVLSLLVLWMQLYELPVQLKWQLFWRQIWYVGMEFWCAYSIHTGWDILSIEMKLPPPPQKKNTVLGIEAVMKEKVPVKFWKVSVHQ